jgi:hypothetical protein
MSKQSGNFSIAMGVFCAAALFLPGAARAVQFNVLDPGYNQQIYTRITNGQEAGMAWTSTGMLLTRSGSDIFEHSLTQNTSFQGSPTPATPLHGVTTIHNIAGLSTSGFGMTSGTDGYIYTVTSGGLQRFDPSNWSSPAQSLAGTVGGLGYGITTLSDGRIAYSDASTPSHVYVYDPSSGSNTLIYSTSSSIGGQIDGMQGGPGGFIAVTDRQTTPTFKIDIITSTGTLINSFSTAHAPDGLAFGDGASSNSLFSNNNDGTITRYDMTPGYSSLILASDIAKQTVAGASYGDLAAVGPDCAFYVTQALGSGLNGSTPGVATHWDNGITTGDPSIVRIAAVTKNSDGTVSEVCGFYSPTEPVPEPGTLALIAAGLGTLACGSRKWRSSCFKRKGGGD